MDSSDPKTPVGGGSHEQFMRLFLQAERELLRYVMAIVPNVSDARDIVQETATALWKKFDQYDPAKPFIAWACRFALNEARMHLRTESRRKRLLSEEVVDELARRREQLDDEFAVRRLHLQDCLAQLPKSQHDLMRGYYFDNEHVEGLAKMFGCSVDAVYKSLQRTRRALLECIERKMQVIG